MRKAAARCGPSLQRESGHDPGVRDFLFRERRGAAVIIHDIGAAFVTVGEGSRIAGAFFFHLVDEETVLLQEPVLAIGKSHGLTGLLEPGGLDLPVGVFASPTREAEGVVEGHIQAVVGADQVG